MSFFMNLIWIFYVISMLKQRRHRNLQISIVQEKKNRRFVRLLFFKAVIKGKSILNQFIAKISFRFLRWLRRDFWWRVVKFQLMEWTGQINGPIWNSSLFKICLFALIVACDNTDTRQHKLWAWRQQHFLLFCQRIYVWCMRHILLRRGLHLYDDGIYKFTWKIPYTRIHVY